MLVLLYYFIYSNRLELWKKGKERGGRGGKERGGEEGRKEEEKERKREAGGTEGGKSTT